MKSLFLLLGLSLPLVAAEAQCEAIPPAVHEAAEGYAKDAAFCDFLVRFTCAGIRGQADYLEANATETDTTRFELALHVLQNISSAGLPEEVKDYLKACETIEIEAINQMKATSTKEEKSSVKEQRKQKMDALALQYPAIALLMDSQSSYFIALMGMNIREEMAKNAQPIVARLRLNELTYEESRRLAAEAMRALVKKIEAKHSKG